MPPVTYNRKTRKNENDLKILRIEYLESAQFLPFIDFPMYDYSCGNIEKPFSPFSFPTFFCRSCKQLMFCKQTVCLHLLASLQSIIWQGCQKFTFFESYPFFSVLQVIQVRLAHLWVGFGVILPLLDALASLDSKLSVSESVIDVFRLAHLRVFQSYFSYFCV